METKGREVSLKFSENGNVISETLSCSKDAEKIFRALMVDIDIYESFIVLYLDNENKVIAWMRHSSGGITFTVVDPRIIFAAALKCLAVNLMVCHNHPSGKLKPSQQDIEITNRIKSIGDIHMIKLLDHLILAPDGGYYSFADEGLI